MVVVPFGAWCSTAEEGADFIASVLTKIAADGRQQESSQRGQGGVPSDLGEGQNRTGGALDVGQGQQRAVAESPVPKESTAEEAGKGKGSAEETLFHGKAGTASQRENQQKEGGFTPLVGHTGDSQQCTKVAQHQLIASDTSKQHQTPQPQFGSEFGVESRMGWHPVELVTSLTSDSAPAGRGEVKAERAGNSPQFFDIAGEPEHGELEEGSPSPPGGPPRVERTEAAEEGPTAAWFKGAGNDGLSPGSSQHPSEKVVEVPQVQAAEKIVSVPQMAAQTVVKQAPETKAQEVVRQVPVSQAQTVGSPGKVPEVPQVQTAEETVPVPQLAAQPVVKQAPETKAQEDVRQVPVSQVQTVGCQNSGPNGPRYFTWLREDSESDDSSDADETAYGGPVIGAQVEAAVDPGTSVVGPSETAQPKADEERLAAEAAKRPEEEHAAVATKGRGKGKDKGKAKARTKDAEEALGEEINAVLAQLKVGHISQPEAIAETEAVLGKFGKIG